MLSMQNISMIYRAGLVETHALREFSLEVSEGDFVSVTGPSGSGKTTFLNIAGLLEQFTDGRYELDGKDVSALSDAEMSAVRNEKIKLFKSMRPVSRSQKFVYSVIATPRNAASTRASIGRRPRRSSTATTISPMSSAAHSSSSDRLLDRMRDG